jgi:hypothetical protein
MKSILVTYPDFQSLPKGIKRMLVLSESLFFNDASALRGRALGAVNVKPAAGLRRDRFGRALPSVLPSFWRN